MRFTKYRLAGAICFVLFVSSQMFASDGSKTRVLILSGSNNHDWKKTTPCLNQILDANDRFTVCVTEKPQTLSAEDLDRYDVIVSNWNAFGLKKKDADWPEATKAAYLTFVRQGGGHVMVHAGGSSFYSWPEYHDIAASWGAKTGHGPVHTFKVDVADPTHPLVRGMTSFSIRDELWNKTAFPENSHVLLTAYSEKNTPGPSRRKLCSVSHSMAKVAVSI
jgi:type 1 glutamine amidotransferase